jgi:hypothetical protein
MTSGLSHRERVLTPLAHRQPDRVPLDLAANVNTLIHLSAYERLKVRLGVQVDECILQRLDISQDHASRNHSALTRAVTNKILREEAG